MPLTPGQYVLRKLPHITALFWAIKILATTLGETAGDYFSQTLGLGTLRAGLVVLVGYQTLDIRRHPLEPLPLPMNRQTGQPQRPNGEVITVAAG